VLTIYRSTSFNLCKVWCL